MDQDWTLLTCSICCSYYGNIFWLRLRVEGEEEVNVDLGSPGPIKGPLAPFWLISSLSPYSLLITKTLECLELSGSVLSASVCHFRLSLQSFLHLRSVSIFLSLLIFFAKCQQQYYQRCMLAFILFLKFSESHIFAMIYAMLSQENMHAFCF